jgi:WD40 repeat protein
LLVLKHPDEVGTVAFSPDGTRLASASLDGTAKVWEVETGRELLTLVGHTNWVRDITFSPTGARLATASYDKTTKIWDAISGQTIFTLDNNTEVNGVAFSPDGARLATANIDGAMHLYVIDDVKPLVALAQTRVTRSLTPEECRRYLPPEMCPAGP